MEKGLTIENFYQMLENFNNELSPPKNYVLVDGDSKPYTLERMCGIMGYDISTLQTASNWEVFLNEVVSRLPPSIRGLVGRPRHNGYYNASHLGIFIDVLEKQNLEYSCIEIGGELLRTPSLTSPPTIEFERGNFSCQSLIIRSLIQPL